MHNCTIRETYGSSVEADSFATVQLRECRLEKSTAGSGLKVYGKYADGSMQQCCVSDVEHSCVEVSSGSQGSVKGCLLSHSRAGAGVAVQGSARTSMLVSPTLGDLADALKWDKGGLVDTKVLIERSILEGNAVKGTVALEGGYVEEDPRRGPWQR
jgi:hypothetical protein